MLLSLSGARMTSWSSVWMADSSLWSVLGSSVLHPSFRFTSSQDTYKRFLEILHTYQKEQKSSGIEEVLEHVSHLFADHTDLLMEFTYFLPDNVQEQVRRWRYHVRVFVFCARYACVCAFVRVHLCVVFVLMEGQCNADLGYVPNLRLLASNF